MLLNCDLGESYGAWKMGLDSHVMPHIDLANIACGFHAGDPTVMANTLALAKAHHVGIGAHPGYPDLQGFGRRSMTLSDTELRNTLHYQIAALEGMARVQGMTLSYVKPHGALYNDMMRDEATLLQVLQTLSEYPAKLKLMLLATAEQAHHTRLAEQFGVELLFEAFADRLYTDQGQLSPRTLPNAVHDEANVLAQVKQLLAHGTVTTSSGQALPLKADTLCVHGDNMDSINQIVTIRKLLQTQ
ncbi:MULTISPECIES: 5-oxoprolinase subunit PxpA [Pseudoalteromonas]|uniref:5-oxoprolinase subunit PxpA n=1 Tax=Pseudoalteromonas TaxID=53246 RepID=UPI001EF5F117|nr:MULTISPECIES: 5-oxoprolinase subunit PxpA [Pseudoalteromonas]MCG7561139.1 5-oxoprolinase subunit PxpA [Pseudoalteromonas sp. McH1-42]MEC4088220.1 5-oxoprolinase subunit PxpA [Pseudoalteromonas rubra]